MQGRVLWNQSLCSERAYKEWNGQLFTHREKAWAKWPCTACQLSLSSTQPAQNRVWSRQWVNTTQVPGSSVPNLKFVTLTPLTFKLTYLDLTFCLYSIYLKIISHVVNVRQFWHKSLFIVSIYKYIVLNVYQSISIKWNKNIRCSHQASTLRRSTQPGDVTYL